MVMRRAWKLEMAGVGPKAYVGRESRCNSTRRAHPSLLRSRVAQGTRAGTDSR